MWRTFTVSDQTYMLKTVEDNGRFNICLSDLTDIWCEEYSKEAVVNMFQECNPTLEIKLEEVIIQVLNIFNGINEAEVSISKLNGKIEVFIKLDLLGFDNTKFKVKYKLDLTLADKKKFTTEVTVPMVHTVNCLEKQQRMLCDLLLKKDRELEEYKMEKGLISRTDLITEKFDLNVIEKSNDTLLLNVYSESSQFWEKFINQYGNVETKVAQVTVEPWNHVKRKRKIYNSKTAAKKASQTILKFKSDTK